MLQLRPKNPPVHFAVQKKKMMIRLEIHSLKILNNILIFVFDVVIVHKA